MRNTSTPWSIKVPISFATASSRACPAGIKYAKGNPDFTVRVLGKYTRNTDMKLLNSAFKSYVLGYIRDVPTVTQPEMESVLEDIAARNPKAKTADPKQFYDLAPLEQLIKEGFVKELYPDRG